jgi:hypothetical protein
MLMLEKISKLMGVHPAARRRRGSGRLNSSLTGLSPARETPSLRRRGWSSVNCVDHYLVAGSQRSLCEVAEREPCLSQSGPVWDPSAALMSNTWICGVVQTFLAIPARLSGRTFASIVISGSPENSSQVKQFELFGGRPLMPFPVSFDSRLHTGRSRRKRPFCQALRADVPAFRANVQTPATCPGHPALLDANG